MNYRAAALAYLGVTHSHPDWLVARWLDRYGFEATERWVQFNNETPRLTVRANRLRVTREQLAAALAADGVETEPSRFAPSGLTIISGNPLRTSDHGLFIVQDEASQLVPLVVEPWRVRKTNSRRRRSQPECNFLKWTSVRDSCWTRVARGLRAAS